MGLGGGGGGGGGGRVIVVVVVLVVMVGPVYCQTGNRGAFHLYKSCGPSTRLSHLVVNKTMWLRGAREDVTLIALENSNKSCVLPSNATHKVTVGLYLEIHVGGAAGEEEHVCYFPKHTVFELPRGVLLVSCFSEKGQAEVEMFDAKESSSSAPSPVRPQPRDLGSPSTTNTTQHPATALETHNSREPLVALTTLQPLKTRTVTEDVRTTLMVKGTASSTQPPPVTDNKAIKTTPSEETTEISDSTSEYVTQNETTIATDSSTSEYVAQDETTVATDSTSATPGTSSSTSSTHETGPAEKLTPSPTPHLDNNKENISVRELSIKENIRQSTDQTNDKNEDQVIYLAGAGAGVLALVVGVVAMASVAHHRRLQAQAKEKEDLFISGAYRGSTHSVNHSGSQGAYLNAHVMYSGAEPEFVESFELEERILRSGVSYSAHDIPKCLKEA